MSKIENRFIQYQYEKKLPVEFNDRDGFSFWAKTDILFKDVYTGEVCVFRPNLITACDAT